MKIVVFRLLMSVLIERAGVVEHVSGDPTLNLDVSQAPMLFWLDLDLVFINTPHVFCTLAVFQWPMSWSNALAPANMRCRRPRYSFHLPMS